MMKVKPLHGWQVSTAEARDIQQQLASQVSKVNAIREPRLVAGVDISPPGRDGKARGAVVVLGLPGLEVVEVQVAQGQPGFPYIPGLLSFRESPLILEACQRLGSTPDFLLVDGQGIAHPRRLGIASHLGLLLDIPSIGCAKSILVGQAGVVGPQPGDWAPLVDGGEVIGAALRTKTGSEPIYVSIGHKVDMEAARRWALACCRGYRLPESTRLAHLAAAGQLPVTIARPVAAQEKLF